MFIGFVPSICLELILKTPLPSSYINPIVSIATNNSATNKPYTLLKYALTVYG